MTFKTADKFVPQPKGAYPGAKSGQQPKKARTQSYTPDLTNTIGWGQAPKIAKQPTEA